MTNRNTKRALFASAVAMLLCVTMLVGTTYAWFTDTEATGKNIIKSGNLDVELSFYRPADPTATNVNFNNVTWTPVDGSTAVFDENALWEPGYTQVVYFKVENVGSLALKYQISENIYTETAGTNQADEIFYLSDYLNTYVAMDITAPIADRATAAGLAMGTEGGKIGTEVYESNLLAGTSAYGVMVVTMPTTVGNEANHKTGSGFQPEIGLGLTLVATQEMYEDDSFGTEYDEDAEYPVTVGTPAELKEALTAGGHIVLATDILYEDTKLAVAANKDVTIDLNGNTLSGVNTVSGTSALIENKGTLSIIGNGTITVLAENPDTDWNPEGFPTYASNTIANRGNLVIGEGVRIENQTAGGGASYAIDNYAGATLTINGGEIIQSGGDVAIRMNTASATAENKVVINGGTISGKRAIWIHLAGGSAATAPKTTLEINGGELSGTQMCIYSYSYGNSFANTNVTITGGTFNGDVQFGGGYKGDQETVSVTGGAFNGALGRWLVNDGWEDIAKP